MVSLGVAIAIALVVLTIIALRSVVVVPADAAWVVERLGRFRQTLHPGLHVLTPFIDQVAFRFGLRPNEKQLTTACITLDNIPTHVTSSVRWQIVDPRVAAYASADPAQFVGELIQSHLRRWIGERTWDDVRQNTRELQQVLLRETAEPAAQAGLKIVSVDATPRPANV